MNKIEKISEEIFNASIGELAKAAIDRDPTVADTCDRDAIALRNFCRAAQWEMARLTCAYAVLLRMNALENSGELTGGII